MLLNPPSAPHSKNNPDVNISYLLLRLAIGIIGISLPVLLVAGTMIAEGCTRLQPSISHYYYSTMHFAFIFTLSILGIFLLTYRSKNKFENWLSNLAGLFAVCVCIFPTGYDGFKDGCGCHYLSVVMNTKPIIGYLHLGFAGLLFTCFIIFCFSIFQKSDELGADPKKKHRRNITYTICGWVIALSIAAIGVIQIFKIYAPYSTFILETTSLLAFGFSWLLKGSLLWKNSGKMIIRYFR